MWTLCQEKREKIIYACVQRELFVFSSCWEQKCIIMCARLKMRDTWHMTMCKCRLVALSLLHYAHSHQPDADVCLGASLSPSHHHPAIHLLPIILSSLCTICVREWARAVNAKEGWRWIMCANLSGIILFSVTSTERSSVSSYVSSSPFFLSLSLVLSLPEAFLLSRKLFANLHPPLICSPSPSSIYPSIHASMPSLGWQWCRAETPWIIYQAGLFFPALLPTFGSPRRWGTFGEAHASHTRKDIINNLSCVDCPMHVCLVKQPESVVVEESIRFRLQGDDW